MAQLVKNRPAIWETCVRSLGWEDPLEKGRATHSSILARRIPWTVLSVGSKRVSDMTERLSLSLSSILVWRTPWTAAYQAPPSMGFSRQEYWSGLPLPSPVELPNKICF